MDIKSNIAQARQVFDQDLRDPAYNQMIADGEHLQALMQLMWIQPGKRYLDLGTGNGYIAFELARLFPDNYFTGLDITPRTIQNNRDRQQQLGFAHLDFKLFDGMEFPCEDKQFDGVVTRYAFHHFPDPAQSLGEIVRILAPGGFFIISDPFSDEEDESTFIDDFQRLRPDGHIHFYKKSELLALLEAHGFGAESAFNSRISYPRDLTPAYTRLLQNTPLSIQQKYQVEIKDRQVYITLQVMNIRFRKVEPGEKP